LQDWEEQQKAKREAQQLRAMEGKGSEESGDEDGSDDEDDLPFACFACRKCDLALRPLKLAAHAVAGCLRHPSQSVHMTCHGTMTLFLLMALP
jgi:hypothetical protein